MNAATQAIDRLLRKLGDKPGVADLRRELGGADHDQAWLAACEKSVPLIEELVWTQLPATDLLADLQAMFRAMETVQSRLYAGARHAFVVVIPVADRPRQLEACLDSLLRQCALYGYGGCHKPDGDKRVQALIVDDSANPNNIAAHAGIARACAARGLPCQHFTPEAQRRFLADSDDPPARELLAQGMSGDGGFAHKGASLTRNVAMLYLAAHFRRPDFLFHFIDSDQTFEIVHAGSSQALPAINYFWHLDRLFGDPHIEVLTGKVVGDPPVSPAVMAGTFLDDVDAYLHDAAQCDPRAACDFHLASKGGGDAAYHDMADLFGFKRPDVAWRYTCHVEGMHDNAAAFDAFSRRLQRFFHGEHPTRVSFFQPGAIDTAYGPARTVYTGNFILRPSALRYFIPFADLRLRMAGPTLGRIIRAELGDGFVSANLPLLHRRTLDRDGASEFRHGVRQAGSGVNIDGEFSRQFLGDVLLFTVDRLAGRGYPRHPGTRAAIRRELDDVEARMQARYLERMHATAARLAQSRAFLLSRVHWWNSMPALAPAVERFRDFFDALSSNFGEDSANRRMLEDRELRSHALNFLLDSLCAYPAQRQVWEAGLGAEAMDVPQGQASAE